MGFLVSVSLIGEDYSKAILYRQCYLFWSWMFWVI
uniref:Uncharacterized protein n=1 Tax=Arundo donax TaxID=35708 RepID=A0A0A9BSW8_ARUDO